VSPYSLKHNRTYPEQAQATSLQPCLPRAKRGGVRAPCEALAKQGCTGGGQHPPLRTAPTPFVETTNAWSRPPRVQQLRYAPAQTKFGGDMSTALRPLAWLPKRRGMTRELRYTEATVGTTATLGAERRDAAPTAAEFRNANRARALCGAAVRNELRIADC
jgi:hypothetical protein